MLKSPQAPRRRVAVPVGNNVVLTAGPVIKDASGNSWGLALGLFGYKVTFNSAVIAATSGVVVLCYVSGVVWQQNNAGNWFSFNVVAGVPGTASGPTTVSPLFSGAVEPFSARAFTNSCSVETQLKYATEIGAGSQYSNQANVTAALAYLNPAGIGTGISLIRETLLDNQPFTKLQAWGALGYKFCMGYFYAGQTNNGNTTDQKTKISSLITSGFVRWVEGPNEVNGFGPYQNPAGQYFSPTGTVYAAGAPSVAGYQMDTWNFFHGTAVNIARWSIGNQANGDGLNGNNLQKALTTLGFAETALMNAGNVHFYTSGGHCPTDPGGGGAYMGSQVSANVGDSTALGLPSVITETGLIDINVNGKFGNQYVNACYTPQIYLHAFKSGILFTTYYELINFSANDGTQETNFGLWDASGFAKLSAVALRNLMTVVSDAGASAATFAPTAIACNVTGLQSPGEWMVLQQSNGQYVIIIWPNKTIFLNGVYTAAPVYTVTVALGRQSNTAKVWSVVQGMANGSVGSKANWNTAPPVLTPVATFSNVSTVTATMGDAPIIITF